MLPTHKPEESKLLTAILLRFGLGDSILTTKMGESPVLGSLSEIMKADKPQVIENLTLTVTAVAGIMALALAWNSQDGTIAALRVSYLIYGILFVAGSLAYYTEPRLGSAVLIVALLSAPIVAAMVGFPVWVDGSAASRIGLILGTITSAGIVSAPFLRSRNREQAQSGRCAISTDP
jgi:hypothetical protein